MRSHEILKSIYIDCHNACGYKTWQSGIYNAELPSITSQGPSLMWSCNVTGNIRCYISTTTGHFATKLSKVVPYYEKLPHIKSHNPLNTWSPEITR